MEKEFWIDVDGVGAFLFQRRTMRNEIQLQAEYARLIEGTDPTPWLELVCTWQSHLKVLMLKAPDGFDLDDLDPFDDVTYENLGKIYSALQAKELSFRTNKKSGVQAGRQGHGADPGLPVSEKVPADSQ